MGLRQETDSAFAAIQFTSRPGIAPRQRGQAALIAVLLLVGAGTAALVYTMASPAKTAIERDKITAAALAQARNALIGRAAADSSIPGSLPCPDTDNDGSAELFAGSNCPSYIGRLPWRTLGLPDLRDSSGERLWYALSPNFRDHSSASPLNSDTTGQVAITGTEPASNIIAVVFAPGAAVGTQVRDSLNENVVANYLEGGNETGIATYTFVTGQTTSTFNDKLIAITSDALFSVVIMRVAKEARTALNSYRLANGYYPAANPYTSGGSAYYCDPTTYDGRIPITIKSSVPSPPKGVPSPPKGVPSPPKGVPSPPALPGCPDQADWGGQLPFWFAANSWNLVTHYAVSEACTKSASTLCDLIGGDPPLTVTGITTNGRMLVIVTGRALGSQFHPCSSAAQCLEDSANTDNDSGRVYVKPSRYPTSNDRMALTCGSSAPCADVP